MSESYRKGQVFVQERLAGTLEETDEGYLFSYAPEYLRQEDALPVSLTMPLTERLSIRSIIRCTPWRISVSWQAD